MEQGNLSFDSDGLVKKCLNTVALSLDAFFLCVSKEELKQQNRPLTMVSAVLVMLLIRVEVGPSCCYTAGKAVAGSYTRWLILCACRNYA